MEDNGSGWPRHKARPTSKISNTQKGWWSGSSGTEPDWLMWGPEFNLQYYQKKKKRKKEKEHNLLCTLTI
jgi:hypothetical protein